MESKLFIQGNNKAVHNARPMSREEAKLAYQILRGDETTNTNKKQVKHGRNSRINDKWRM